MRHPWKERVNVALWTLSVCSALLSVLAVAWWPAPSRSLRAQPRQSSGDDRLDEDRPTAVYILIIDHSSSMVTEDMTGPDGQAVSRWQYMRRLAADFVKSASLNTKVSLYIFEGYEIDTDPSQPEKLQLTTKDISLETPEDRELAAQYILNYPEPDVHRGTALHDTLAVAFEQAAMESDAHPGQYIRVMVYSDGEDEHSRKYRDVAALTKKYQDLVSRNGNTYLFFSPLGDHELEPPLDGPHVGIGSPKHPVPLNIQPGVVQLKSARNSPEQTVRLDLTLSAEHAELLEGRVADVEFESETVEVEPLDRLPLEPGPASLTVKVTNAGQLQLDQQYSGRLELSFPELPRHHIQATPPEGVEVQFQQAGKLEITDTGPRPGAVFAVDNEIEFFATTLQEASVTWDFGDGTKSSGQRVHKIYRKDGEHEVVVRATASGLQPADPVRIPITVLDMGARIEKPSRIVFAGEPVTLRCVGHGPIERYEWVIENAVLPGASGKGETVEYRFDEPGQYPVRVKAYSEYGAPFYSDELQLDVLARPTLAIVQPPLGSSYVYGDDLTIGAKATGTGIESVNFSIRAAGTDKVLFEEQVRLTETTDESIARAVHRFAEANTRDAPVVIRAAAVMKPEYGIDPPEHEITLQPPPFDGKIEIRSTQAERIGLNDPFQLELQSASHRISRVQWQLGDGTAKEGRRVSHHYEHHADGDTGYTIVANVFTPSTVDSGSPHVLERTLDLIRRRPVADFVLLDESQSESVKFQAGKLVTINDLCRGDIGRQVFEVDGQPLPDGTVSFRWERTGEHTVTAKVWPIGSLGGEPVTLTKRFRVVRYGHAFFLSIVGVCAGGLWLARSWCTGNAPVPWEIRVAPVRVGPGERETEVIEKIRQQDLDRGSKAKVQDYWSRRAKNARVPMRELMKHTGSAYWKTGGGRTAELVIGAVKRGGEARGGMEFSDKRDPAVTWELLGGGTATKRDYELLDARAPEDERFRHVLLRLDEKERFPTWDALGLLAAVVATVAALLWAANEAYFVNL